MLFPGLHPVRVDKQNIHMNHELESQAWRRLPAARGSRGASEATPQTRFVGEGARASVFACGAGLGDQQRIATATCPIRPGRRRKGAPENPGQEMGCQPLIQCRLPSRRHHWAGSQTRRTASATYIINKHLTLTIAHQPRKLNPRESHPNQQSANSPPTSSLALTENGDDDNNNNNNKPTPRKQREKRRTPSGDEKKKKKR